MKHECPMKFHQSHWRILFLLFFSLFQFSLSQFAQASHRVRLASDDWCPFVCEQNGKIQNGFLVDVSIRAMILSGYKVEPELRPLTRAIHETVAHVIAGVYAPPQEQGLRLSLPIEYSRACFYSRIERSWQYKDMDSLSGKTIGVIANYGYDHDVMDAYIAQNLQKKSLIELAYGDTAGISNLQKLMKGRYHVLLEHEAVMDQLSQRLNLKNQIKQVGCLAHALPLTVGFSKQGQHTEAWISALNNGLLRLEATGELNLLRQQYGIKHTVP